MKTKLLLLLTLLLTFQLRADCIDPMDPNCINTNNPPITNSYTAPIYPPGSLQFSFITTNQIGVTNSIDNHLYVIEQTTNLTTWFPFIPEFTNASNAEKVFNYTNANDIKRNFRIRETTYFTIFEEVIPFGGSDTAYCPGPYTRQVRFYKDPPLYGYAINSNVPIHTVSVQWTNNVRIQYAGAFGDAGCGTNTVTINNPYSPIYRFVLLFTGSGPSTNEDFPATFQGFLP